MALGNVSSVDRVGFAPGEPTYCDVVELDLDTSYPATPGYTDFASAVEAYIGKGKTIVAVAQLNQPAAFICRYDGTALRVYTEALVEVADTVDLVAAGMVGVQLLVVSK